MGVQARCPLPYCDRRFATPVRRPGQGIVSPRHEHSRQSRWSGARWAKGSLRIHVRLSSEIAESEAVPRRSAFGHRAAERPDVVGELDLAFERVSVDRGEAIQSISALQCVLPPPADAATDM
jgi:hypothetical protein